MTRQISSLWFYQPSDLLSKVEHCIDIACEHVAFERPKYVFFRADDVAVPGNRFARLLELFTTYEAPLSLAVVPAWLTRLRWQHIKELDKKIPSILCWHQHGWRHINHEINEKKQEFGSVRPTSLVREDLVRGRSRLEDLMGEAYYPVFTPPWNRCSLDTLVLLKELGYHAVSRHLGSRPLPPDGLPDFPVNVDLHTRKETNPAEGWERLFAELGKAVYSGFCGIMIHHQRMNNMSFNFIEMLLQIFLRRKDVLLMHLKDLAENVSVK